MPHKERNLTKANVDNLLREYAASVEEVVASIQGLKGLALLESLKREKVKVGPYPHVTLFEAANRIMTDLVIYNGVKWLLDHDVFPFDSYIVEFGNEDKNGFDLKATSDNASLIGEAFNVAPSFFQGKKTSMLKKLRKDGVNADYRIIMVNHDAVADGYSPIVKPGEYYVFVNVSTALAVVVPNTSLQRTSLTGRRLTQSLAIILSHQTKRSSKMNVKDSFTKHLRLFLNPYLFCALIFVIGCNSGNTMSEDSLRQSMTTLMENLKNAAIERDVDKILSMCDESPEFLFISDGQDFNYNNFVKIEHSGFASMQKHQLSWDTLHIKILGSDVVAAYAPFHQVITDTSGIESRLKGGVSWIAVQKDGILKLRYGQAWHAVDN